MIVAISGKMGSGKTTLASLLVKYRGFEPLSFATPLKNFVHDLYPWITQKKRFRPLYQSIGTKIREHDPHAFANKLLHEARHYNNVVVDDLRYPNEYAILLGSALFVRLERSGEVASNHESETALDDHHFDVYIPGQKNARESYKYLEAFL